jgi:hypothetical protein
MSLPQAPQRFLEEINGWEDLSIALLFARAAALERRTIGLRTTPAWQGHPDTCRLVRQVKTFHS